MLAKPGDKLFRRNLKRFADSQQSGDGKMGGRLRIHVLLAQLAFGSMGSNPMAQGAKEARIVGRKVSGGAHSFRLRLTRANIPRANLRFVCDYEFVTTM